MADPQDSSLSGRGTEESTQRARLGARSSVFRRHPVLSLVLFNSLVLLLLLVGLECVLRVIGLKSEREVVTALASRVADPTFIDSYYTDEEGVFKATPEWFRLNKPDLHVNKEGFRSIEFDTTASSCRVLFIGDSFTWGAAAEPITNCFVEKVAARGPVCFNMGIPGTGTEQYAHLAKKWIPRLKPDLVAVMFFMGNDFHSYPMIPNHPPFYVTREGVWLAAFEHDKPIGPERAREIYTGYLNAKLKTTLARRLLLTSVVGSKLMQFVEPAGRTHVYLDDAPDPKTYRRPMENLQTIRTVAEEHGAKFALFILPIHPLRMDFAKTYREHLELLKPFNPIVPTGFSRKHYEPVAVGDHFNNEGHAKYAEMILQHVRSLPRCSSQI